VFVAITKRDILEIHPRFNPLSPQTLGREVSLHSLGISDLEFGDHCQGLRPSARPCETHRLMSLMTTGIGGHDEAWPSEDDTPTHSRHWTFAPEA